MNNLYKIIILSLLQFFILSCKGPESDNKKFFQSIDNFDMKIYSSKGEKLFSINSPYSYYEKKSNIFNLDKTTILLYKDNQTEYIINADKSKLSNNKKLLNLKGNVLVKRIGEQTEKLYANSFRWNISNSEYMLIGNVKFENKLITLSSNKAILNKLTNIIEFFNPVEYIMKDNSKEIYEIKSENAFYNINTKSVSFKSKDERVRSKIYF